MPGRNPREIVLRHMERGNQKLACAANRFRGGRRGNQCQPRQDAEDDSKRHADLRSGHEGYRKTPATAVGCSGRLLQMRHGRSYEQPPRRSRQPPCAPR